ncbi:MAG: polysaccharide pyruvyl transferase family protein [Gammaproteobacteria bacterium]|nr:polysaccharide pyruvyl transferase family protein [Gammaproteobacteria bacterium]NNL50944.1 hypothetical protein [Woeseiaceae bacterium]
MNLGDEALLLGAIECARVDAGLGPADIVVLSDNKEDTTVRLEGIGCEVRQLRRPYGGKLVRLPFVMVDVFRALRGLDWLVFGGGGLLNDSNRTAIPMYTLIRILAWFRGIRIAWWSIGIGPLQDGARKRMASWLLSSSRFFTVRDDDSYRMACEMLTRDVTVTPDLAHAIQYSATETKAELPIIAISVIPYKKPGIWFEESGEQYAMYCDKIVHSIQGLLHARADIHVRLFPVSLQQDGAAIDDIMALGNLATEGRVDEVRPETVQSLLSELGQTDLVIATRLHSVVLATIARVPAITIAYQPKVASYARELDMGLPCFGIDEFSSQQVVDASLATIEHTEGLPDKLLRENAERRLSLSRAITSWRALT